MTNTERIQANNAALRECIGLAEDLPNAGNGGGFTPPASEALDPDTVYRTTRPGDWLPMPTPGDDEIYLLGQLVEGIDNYFSIYLQYPGSCTVEIGNLVNGVFVAKATLPVENRTAFTYAVPYDEYGDMTSDGYRQYLVKCKGTVNQCYISRGSAGISSIVDCVVGNPKIIFVAGSTGDVSSACHTLRYLRFVGSGYPTWTQGMVGYCKSLLAVSCEQLLTSNTEPGYSFTNATSLIAVSPNLLAATGNMIDMFRGTSLRRVPMGNLRPTSIANLIRESDVVFVDGSTFGDSTNWNMSFYNCRSLKEAVNLNITKASGFSNTFGYCESIEKLTFAGDTAVGGYTINLSTCKLGHTALVNMINSLPVATAAGTLTITGNPGASDLTADEIAIATAKNWTITI